MNMNGAEDEVEKGASSKIQNDKHVLLGNDAHMVVDMLDHWNDGILSIGTIAISPLEACKYGMLEEEDDVRDHEMANIVNEHDVDIDNYEIECDNEASPLMNVEFFSHELEKVIGANHEIIEEEVVENVVELKDANNCDVNENEGQTKRRVTLADLFLEDSDYHPVKVLKEVEDVYVDDAFVKDDTSNGKLSFEMTLKPTSRAKNGISKAKKLIKEDLHPLKKFNKLMKRMMKKKIHPEFEGKTQKDMHMDPSYGLRDPINDQDAANNELASLLLIQ
uniref:Protein TILLER ANGLE CONTROL 1 n=1 Tax=Chenopodium quinoa TaxID=63459 RepID=A0A803L9V1_CHEQI